MQNRYKMYANGEKKKDKEESSKLRALSLLFKDVT